tara:strand:+ start:49 stop:498 length:450 start_codon:yes stop_codon:yes gene_type:complete
MTYRDSSNQNGEVAETAARLAIMKRGWQVTSAGSRDSAYDLIIDMQGSNDEFKAVRAQVKKLSGNMLAKLIDRSGEVVSKNGKPRESTDYAKEGIEWIIGYSLEKEKVYFYHIDTYSKIPTNSFSVAKYPPDDFPTYDVPKRHTKRKGK